MKFLRLMGVILLLSALLFGCAKETTLDPQALSAQLLDQIDFPAMLEIEAERLTRFYPFGADVFSVHKVYLCAEAVLADEIAIFQVKDAAKIAEIKQQLQSHYQGRAELYADYAPQESERIKKRVFVENGRWLVVIVSDDNELADKLVRQAFK